MKELVVSGSLQEFFRSLLGEVRARQGVALTPVTEFYVVNLLSEFAAAERLFVPGEAGGREVEALALLYYRAMQQERPEQVKTLRRLGDVSLYTAGFFGGALKDRPVGPDYVIQMGTRAYAALSELSAASAFSTVYQELHTKFAAVVELLGEMSARGLCNQGPSGQLRVFESWARSADGTLERVLVDAGVFPPKGPAN
jgi:hypothetical protein